MAVSWTNTGLNWLRDHLVAEGAILSVHSSGGTLLAAFDITLVADGTAGAFHMSAGGGPVEVEATATAAKWRLSTATDWLLTGDAGEEGSGAELIFNDADLTEGASVTILSFAFNTANCV